MKDFRFGIDNSKVLFIGKTLCLSKRKMSLIGPHKKMEEI